jgi:spermidine synthase
MAQLNQLIRSFNQQVGKVEPEGYILQGSVVRRNLRRRARGVIKTYGPYYLWTRKVNNKTVTRALTIEQARIIRDAIRRNHKMEQRLADLRYLSEQIIESITPCVAKRKRV